MVCGNYTATAHRVINNGPDRYSFPYFMVPNHAVNIEPLVPALSGFKDSTMPVGELTAKFGELIGLTNSRIVRNSISVHFSNRPL